MSAHISHTLLHTCYYVSFITNSTKRLVELLSLGTTLFVLFFFFFSFLFIFTKHLIFFFF